MKRSVLLFALIAFVLTGGTVFLVNKWLQQERARVASLPAKPAAEANTFVLVAARDIPAGNFVNAADLRWQSWPDQSVPNQYVVRGAAVKGEEIVKNFTGAVVRQGILAGQPVSKDVMVKPGDRGFLAAVLRPGTRAIAVRVDEATGVAGLVFPGDRVDIVMLHEVNRVRIGETILTGVRVIAIDQVLSDLKAQGSKGAQTGGIRAKTVTLELTPKQVEIVAVAIRMGMLTLSLQSLACKDGVAESASAGDAPSCAEHRTTSALPDEIIGAERGNTFTTALEVTRALSHRNADVTEVSIVRGVRETVVRAAKPKSDDKDGKADEKDEKTDTNESK
jgi:pilus assembly protein CpaB